MRAEQYAMKKFVLCSCGRIEWRKWKDLGEINGKLKEKLNELIESHGICSICLRKWFELFKFKDLYEYDFYVLKKNGRCIFVDDPFYAIKKIRCGWALEGGFKR